MPTKFWEKQKHFCLLLLVEATSFIREEGRGGIWDLKSWESNALLSDPKCCTL